MADDRIYQDLLGKLRSPDRKVVADAARRLGDLGDPRAVSPLLVLLRETNDPVIRNAAAVGLGELGDQRAVPALALLLADPKTEGQRGTLVYALRNFDCAPLLPLLVDLVITGGFEVSREALQAIESIESEITPKMWTLCLRKIKEAQPNATDDKADLLRELRDLFEEQ